MSEIRQPLPDQQAFELTAAEREERWQAARPSVAWGALPGIDSTPPPPGGIFSDWLQTGVSAPVLSQIPPLPVSRATPPGTP
jgi:hypothetical protein